jgi:hypothetical protein
MGIISSNHKLKRWIDSATSVQYIISTYSKYTADTNRKGADLTTSLVLFESHDRYVPDRLRIDCTLW